ncbi:hypothetical protein I7I53_05155 [Histoplasma capsulatum var. duboisii H88]|uniref:Uncharacterized protein n=1 Tax=Ajellomyces capsulatus (strain H88) TaxID=544711 RepID=A0A8A1LWP6_AJEC8|nr:hypothetical protein I7I53_05155 [Histoplasma capsulatum var. duboisii H88]
MGRVSLPLQGRKQNGDIAMAPKGKPKIYSRNSCSIQACGAR